MKTKYILYPVILLCLFLSCTKKQTDISQEATNSYAYFEKNLKSGMDYTAIVSKFGQPIKDIGSGIHIYVYVLDDATEIWIGYVDKILYARHMDKTQKLIKTLI